MEGGLTGPDRKARCRRSPEFGGKYQPPVLPLTRPEFWTNELATSVLFWEICLTALANEQCLVCLLCESLQYLFEEKTFSAEHFEIA